MTALDQREAAFENKFAHDEEVRFKVTNRRNKLLGLWAAEQLGKDDAAAYAKEVVLADFAEAGDEDVVRKVQADFDAAGVAITPDAIRAKLNELLPTAKQQIMTE